MTDDADARDKIRQLRGSRRFGALAVTSADGSPYVATAAYTPDGDEADVLLLLSRLSDHRRFLEARSDAALLIEAPEIPAKRKLASPRVTLIGTVTMLERTDELRATWLATHPESEMWVDFPDFDFFRFETRHSRLIEGFGSQSRVRFRE